MCAIVFSTFLFFVLLFSEGPGSSGALSGWFLQGEGCGMWFLSSVAVPCVCVNVIRFTVVFSRGFVIRRERWCYGTTIAVRLYGI